MFYLMENDKIVLFDGDKAKLEKTIAFMPQYEGLEILETDKQIVNFDGSFYFEDDEQYLEQVKKQEAERIAKLSLTKREVFLAIFKDKGITPEQIRAKITDTEALIEFDYAEKYYRGNPLINVLGASLGYTEEQLDYLFEFKSFPPVEVSESNTGVEADV